MTKKPLDLEPIKALLEGSDGVFWKRTSATGVMFNVNMPTLIHEVERLRLGLRGIANRPCFSALLGDDVDDCGCPACSARALLGKE